MGTPTPAERIFCAIDTPDRNQAIELASALKGAVGGFKLGKEFFTANGPDGVAEIAELGQRIFLDLKFHDIPNTVAGAVKAVMKLNCYMLTVHASGGRSMIRAAAEATSEETLPLIMAVTVLTSLNTKDLIEIGQKTPVEDQVLKLGKIAHESGANGLIASPKELKALRAALGPKCLLTVPGIRPLWASSNDQKRIMPPLEAIKAGADFLVIGRPITQAKDPKAAADRISAEIAEGYR
ncbi:MAG: orotidine-5'-phosphate decarboxylase [Rhodospirillaceae bacterium]|nr:orotidine-5'-phosphate decarboxylase [Rhodospirillaceae bacterium]